MHPLTLHLCYPGALMLLAFHTILFQCPSNVLICSIYWLTLTPVFIALVLFCKPVSSFWINSMCFMAPFHHLYLLMATRQLDIVFFHFTVSPFSLAGIVCTYRFYVSFSSISPSLSSHGCSIAPQVSIASSLYSFFHHSAVPFLSRIGIISVHHLNVYQRSISLPLFSHKHFYILFLH